MMQPKFGSDQRGSSYPIGPKRWQFDKELTRMIHNSPGMTLRAVKCMSDTYYFSTPCISSVHTHFLYATLLMILPRNAHFSLNRKIALKLPRGDIAMGRMYERPILFFLPQPFFSIHLPPISNPSGRILHRATQLP